MKRKIIIVFIILIGIVFLGLESKSFFMEESDFKLVIEENEESYYSDYTFDNETDAGDLPILESKDFIQESFIWHNLKSFMWGIDEMDLEHGLLRNNDGFIYSIHKLKEGYFISTYSKGIVVDSWCVEKIPNKIFMTMFLHKGMTAENLEKFDSSIRMQSAEGSSIHRFNDGTMLVVMYNNDGNTPVVEDYDYYKDEIELLKHLLPKDKKLIE